MKIKMLMLCVVLVLCGTAALAEETDPGVVVKKALAAYAGMDTYDAEGTILSDIDTGAVKVNLETSFSIKLKKPNLYLISWEQRPMMVQAIPQITQSGAVWNNGAQPYLYMGIGPTRSYSKMSDDRMALSSATGISGGVAFTIPSLFLSVFGVTQAPLSRLVDPKLEAGEKIEGEDCYVIGGSSVTLKREVFWISKTTFLIRKYSRSLEPPKEGMKMPTLTDEELADVIKSMGQEVTEESKAAMRKMMQDAADTLRTTKLKGTSTELHTKIGTPKLAEADFVFKLPSDAVLKDSLWPGTAPAAK